MNIFDIFKNPFLQAISIAVITYAVLAFALAPNNDEICVADNADSTHAEVTAVPATIVSEQDVQNSEILEITVTGETTSN
tara:strand:- start:8026 stop:8265 length:240 start_codon:yes stop_codon:yes gene_type:complete